MILVVSFGGSESCNKLALVFSVGFFVRVNIPKFCRKYFCMNMCMAVRDQKQGC